MREIEQRYVMKRLEANKFALDRIVAELALVHGEQTSAPKAVVYRIH
jgi:hypothetical protein